MSFDAPPPLRERVLGLLEPALLLVMAISHYIQVCIEAIKRGEILAPVTQTAKLRDEAFARFWIAFTSSRPPPPPTDEPAQIQPSSLIPPLLKTASGIVLDIGPGTGSQMPLLKSESISAIYGAEPCIGLHKALYSKAIAEGLASKYYILSCSVTPSALLPALDATGTGVINSHKANGDGIFDTIICVRVLCSVPDLEQTMRELYGLLRPGGRVLVMEHVVNPWRTAKGSIAARIAQGVYQGLGWSFFIGDCCLDRDVEGALRGAADGDGGWESVDIERWMGWSALPHISGVLVKKRN